MPTPPGARRASRQILNAGALWPRIEADKGVSDRDRRDLEAGASDAPAAPAPGAGSRHPRHRRPGTRGTRGTRGTCFITIDDFMKVELKVGEGPRGRAGAEVEEAAEAEGRCR